MSLLMQALRRAETVKKSQSAVPAEPGAPVEAVIPPAPRDEMTLELKEPSADERAAASERAQAAAAADAAQQGLVDGAPSAAPEPVDYFAGEVPPARAPYHIPEAVVAAPQGFDPERGAGAGSAAPVPAPAMPIAQSEPVTPAPVTPAAAQLPPVEPASQQSAQARSAARTVFAAKQEVRSRRPLIIAATGLLVLATGAGIFYFLLLQSATPVPFTPSAAPAPASVAVLLPDSGLTPATPATPSAPLAAVPAALPAAAISTVVARAAPPPAAYSSALAPSAPRRAAPGATPLPPTARGEGASVPERPVRAPRVQASAAAAPPPIEVRRMEASRDINPALVGAYQAFVAGDSAGARSAYQRVLQQEPDNRDALLGMAAIAVNRGQGGEAGAFYARLLELDPSDAQAAAGMASTQRSDPSQAESRLKSVLAASPDTGVALFALGNLYAEQARWPEAQLAYFRAVGSEPANAGYAFNLAVSLDKLNQKKLALEYYRRALALARKGGTTVDQAATAARISQLELDPAPR